VLAYGALLGLLGLGTLPAVQQNQVADLPYFVGLALATIYIGAHRGLTTGQRQMISFKEGILAPIMASVSLFGCYLLIKYLPDFSLQTFLNGYFWLLGSIAGIGAFGPLLRQVGGPLGQKSLQLPLPEGLLQDEQGESVRTAEFAPSDVLAVVLSLAVASGDLASNHSNFTLNNLMACLIATDILQLVGLRSFRTAGLMLCGLLLYDVFWVFGSPKVIGDNVMLTVATSDIITGPMRILFPRQPGGVGEAADFQFSLLGLGDIAIPGLLACLALRYDASRTVDMKARAQAAAQAITDALASLEPGSSGKQMAETAADAAFAAYDRVADRELQQRENTVNGVNAGSSLPATSKAASMDTGLSSAQETQGGGSAQAGKVVVSEAVLQQRPYFQAVAGSYIGGLLAAFAANNITHLGQPALLYIVPATLGAVMVTGPSRDELGRLWEYTDLPSFGIPVPGESSKEST